MESLKSNLNPVEKNWDLFFKSTVFTHFEATGNSLIQSEAFANMDTQSPVFTEFKSASYALVASLKDSVLLAQSSPSTETVPALKMSSTFIGNSTSLMTLWNRVSEQFNAMLRRKAFLHWYTQEPDDESTETTSQINLTSFVQGYLAYQESISQ
ncbi:hypothetical protein [Flectobacillus roseus]|uniref:Uncharacterized protein n=1 Tax=Flectobacillus roseus TaxID=502259 RepID=A0ABT6Y7V5_9BACT|nr:hypothetical protein [Flectobacillus roseus]MDI9859331.1 hypothetical protein [Flectobacillus roseus]